MPWFLPEPLAMDAICDDPFNELRDRIQHPSTNRTTNSLHSRLAAPSSMVPPTEILSRLFTEEPGGQ